MHTLGKAKEYTSGELAVEIASALVDPKWRDEYSVLVACEATVELLRRVIDEEKSAKQAASDLALERAHHEATMSETKAKLESYQSRADSAERIASANNMLFGLFSRNGALLDQAILSLCASYNKMDAIKLYRSVKSASLAAGKEYVERLVPNETRTFPSPKEVATALGISEPGATALIHLLRRVDRRAMREATTTDTSQLRTALMNIMHIDSTRLGPSAPETLYVMEQLGLLDESLDTLSPYTVRTIAVIVLGYSGYPNVVSMLKSAYRNDSTFCADDAYHFTTSIGSPVSDIIKRIISI